MHLPGKFKPRYLKDLTGRKFGKLTAKSYSHTTEDGDAIWNCDCECGGGHKARRRSLVKGGTRSCGCARAEASKRNGLLQRSAHNYSWKGGSKNRGSEAWASIKINSSRAAAKKFGYKAVEANPKRIMELWAEANGVCVATGLKFDTKRKPHLDHCHLTTKARGFLCTQANVVVGLVGEDSTILRKIADYIDKCHESDRTCNFDI